MAMEQNKDIEGEREEGGKKGQEKACLYNPNF